MTRVQIKREALDKDMDMYGGRQRQGRDRRRQPFTSQEERPEQILLLEPRRKES